MKKSLLIVSLLAVALAACTKKEEVAPAPVEAAPVAVEAPAAAPAATDAAASAAASAAADAVPAK